MMRIFLVFVCFCFSCGVFADASPVYTESQANSVFKDRLYAFMHARSNADYTTSGQQKAAKESLLNYAKEFPDSRFSDDAIYFAIITVAGANKDEGALEDMIKRYPNAKIEPETKDFLKEDAMKMYGEDIYTKAGVLVPYPLALASVRGERAMFIDKDYEKAKGYFETIVNTAQINDVYQKPLIKGAYSFLVGIYKKLGDTARSEEVKQKSLKLFSN